jgi:hypothetical protein
MDYETILEEAKNRFTQGIIEEIQRPDFGIDQLILLILEEGSPLQNILGDRTIQLADVYQAADKLFHSAKHLDEMEDGGDNVERDR